NLSKMKLKIRFPGKLWAVGKRENVLAALAMTLFSVLSYGQGSLKPGNMVPDVTVGKLLNYPERSVKISGFCGKVLILDFWDTWCSSCVRMLPRVDSLQKEFGDKLFILPVTDQKEELVRHFLKTNGYLAGFRITTAVEDKVLNGLFPHKLLPHEVWIGPGGEVLGITTGQYVNARNINLVLEGKKPDWMVKEDGKPIDDAQPFLSIALLERTAGDAPVFTECLTGYLKGQPLKAGVVRHDSTTCYYFINHPLLHLYALALGSPLPFNAKRRVLEVDDTSDYVYSAQSGYRNSWEAFHSFSYEATVPLNVPEAAVLEELKTKLDLWTGRRGSIRAELTDCLVLRAADSSSLKTSYAVKDIRLKDNILHAVQCKDLAWVLDREPGLPPVFNECGIQRSFDLDLAAWPRGTEAWNAVLKPLGLELRTEKRMLPMFVLEKPVLTQPLTHPNP
ncbi:MAG: TlpA family protein disulfide reductase, partial [Sphingobacteriales bacterium]